MFKPCDEAKFMVVGDYSSGEINRAYYAKIEGLLKSSGMTPWFVFTGYRQDVPDFLDAFDIAVLSTHQEGLPLVLLEGMARARPTVATAVDGIPEGLEPARRRQSCRPRGRRHSSTRTEIMGTDPPPQRLERRRSGSQRCPVLRPLSGRLRADSNGGGIYRVDLKGSTERLAKDALIEQVAAVEE